MTWLRRKEGKEVEDRVVTMPEKDVMLERLTEANNSRPAIEIFEGIVSRNAGQEITARGLANLVTLEMMHLESYSPIIAAYIFMQLDDFIKALVLDDEVADRAIILVAKAQQDLKSSLEAQNKSQATS